MHITPPVFILLAVYYLLLSFVCKQSFLNDLINCCRKLEGSEAFASRQSYGDCQPPLIRFWNLAGSYSELGGMFQLVQS